jgi:cyclic-di-GMP-binding protein
MAEVAISDVLGNQLQQEKQLEKFFRTATPQSLKAHLASMPAGVSEQMVHLNAVLKVLSELDVQPVQVFSLLETVRPVVYDKFNMLTSRFLGRSSVFPPRVQELLGQAVALLSHLAASYDNVVEETRAQGDKQAFILGAAIQRAMADKAYLLYCYLQLYLPVPQQIWRQFHKLYIIAAENKLLIQTTPDTLVFPRKPLNLRQIYLYAMMLDRSDTPHLSSADIKTLSEALKDWVPHITIADSKPDKDENPLVINLEAASGAVFYADLTNKYSNKLIFLQLDKFVAFLKGLKKYSLRISLSEEWLFDKPMIEKLIDQWTVHKPKSTDRVALNEIVVVAMGLPAVHYYLSGFRDPDTLVGNAVFSDKDPTGRLTYGEFPSGFRVLTSTPAAMKIDKPLFGYERVLAVDQSPGGYCLEWLGESLEDLSVGEIIAIRHKLSPYWKVGEIVTITHTDDKKVRTGINIISTEAVPVVARLLNKPDVLPILLCPAEKPLNRKSATAVVPLSACQMGEKLQIAQLGNTRAIQLMQPIKNNDSCVLFECAYLATE